MSQLNDRGIAALLVAAGVVLAGCAPTITVYNKTHVGVRVAVFPPAGAMQVVSPSPGSSSDVEVTKTGRFTAAVILNQRWVEEAKATRQTLMDLLADPQSLTPDAIRNLNEQLRRIDSQIKQFEDPGPTSGRGNGCSGEMSVTTYAEDPLGILGLIQLPDSGLVEVTMDTAGNLQAACGSTKPK